MLGRKKNREEKSNVCTILGWLKHTDCLGAHKVLVACPGAEDAYFDFQVTTFFTVLSTQKTQDM